MVIHPIELGPTFCHLIVGDQGRCVFVDTGFPGKEAAFDAALEQLSMTPEQIGLVVVTHGHWDHVGCAEAIKNRTGAPLAMHARDKGAFELGRPVMPPGVTPWGKVLSVLMKSFVLFAKLPPTKVDIVLTDEGMDLAPHGVAGRIIHTPGHSPGSVSIVLESGDALVGDLAMNALPLRRRPGLPIFAEDPAQVLESWRMLLELDIHTIHPAHGPSFPADVIRECLGAPF